MIPPDKSVQPVPASSRGKKVKLPAGPAPARTVILEKEDPARLRQDLETCLDELVRYYRHSAAGRRCTGIVHLMNSPLQALSFQLELLEMRGQEEHQYLEDCSSPDPDTLRPWCAYRLEKFKQIRQELQNFQGLTRRLITQGLHEESQQRTFLDLNGLFQEELELYQADLFYRHEVKKVIRLQGQLHPVYGHYLDFSQSFRNLVNNALEAVELANPRVLTVETAVQGSQSVIRIGDTGPGIPPEVLPRIFGPFFTTKDGPGHPHAGLGLFMARRLLAPYGGAIQVQSRPGQTWATMTIPAASGEGQS